MAIPKNLKIGDTFTENDFKGPLLYKVTGFDGAGNYISEYIGRVEKKAVAVEEPEKPIEPIPFDAVEEPKPEEKKAAPRKRTPAKRKPATKKK